ncbi:MAG TPA: 3-deoxy-7-phosphoheptulonate synthase [Thermoanaerobaculia bacterium]|jgi:3-deoxy-7-phosphoheptulonate synthase|nr:3-deoxy-7-phosphoheptulonate synthase [Thermoanaerobaculia bacterium]
MVIVMQKHASDAHIERVVAELSSRGFDVHRSTGSDQTVLGVVGRVDTIDQREFELFDGVQEVVRVSEPYKLSSRTWRREKTIVNARGVEIGGDKVVILAGPCTIENEEQMFETARRVARAGARVLRGGAYKPRTSPYAFQGMGVEGLKLLRAAGDENDMATVSEVMEIGQIEKMLDYVDILQVGARNMQNYNLLSALGQVRKPVLLKRGMSATIQEWLLAAEYIMAGGNYDVILCERGIRTFETYTRNTLDISAIPVIDKLSHLPIIADPSHAVGRRDKVMPVARAIVAAGGDGVLIEVHHDPEKAVCDGPQSLYPDQFARLMDELRIIVPAVGRSI